MLAYILAIAVGFGSFAFLVAAFFFTEVHRKIDFLWSGVGLFYALVLWICAGRMTGGVLLGQTAAVSLIIALGWQLLTLRRAKTPSAEQTEISPEVEEKVKGFSPASIFSPITKLFRKSKPTSTPAEPVQSVATLVEPETAEEVEVSDAASESTETIESPPIDTFDGEEETIAASESTETIESPPIDTFDAEEETIAASETVETIGFAEIDAFDAEETKAELLESNEDETSALEESVQENISEAETAQLANPPQPPATDLVEASKESKKQDNNPKTPIEEFAPEAELAPFAEPPEMNDAVPNGKDEEN